MAFPFFIDRTAAVFTSNLPNVHVGLERTFPQSILTPDAQMPDDGNMNEALRELERLAAASGQRRGRPPRNSEHRHAETPTALIHLVLPSRSRVGLLDARLNDLATDPLSLLEYDASIEGCTRTFVSLLEVGVKAL